MGKFKVIKEIPEDQFSKANHPELTEAVKAYTKLGTEEALGRLEDCLVSIGRKGGMVIVPLEEPSTLKAIMRGGDFVLALDMSIRKEVISSFFTNEELYRRYEKTRQVLYPLIMPLAMYLQLITRVPEINGIIIDFEPGEDYQELRKDFIRKVCRKAGLAE